MIRRKFSRPVLAVTAALTVIAVGGTAAGAEGLFGDTFLGHKVVGAQADGSHLMHTGQFVTPVGDVITENGRPFGLALSPDGRTAASLNSGGATTGMVSVFDLVNHKVLQQTGTGGKANGGVLYPPTAKPYGSLSPVAWHGSTSRQTAC